MGQTMDREMKTGEREVASSVIDVSRLSLLDLDSLPGPVLARAVSRAVREACSPAPRDAGFESALIRDSLD
jgi:FXSXX-COOH protein